MVHHKEKIEKGKHTKHNHQHSTTITLTTEQTQHSTLFPKILFKQTEKSL